jgi:hypothetical protein
VRDPRRRRPARAPDRLDHELDRVARQGERRGGRGLRHPVAGHELGDAEALGQVAPEPRRADRRGGHDRVEAREVVVAGRRRLDDRERHRRHEQRLGGAVALDRGERLDRVERRLRDHGAADEQRCEQPLDVPEDVVQRQREQDPPAVLERARPCRAVRAAELHVVRQDDALRRAGRARRVDDGRRLAGVHGGRARVELAVELAVELGTGVLLELRQRDRVRPRDRRDALAQHHAAEAGDRRAASAPCQPAASASSVTPISASRNASTVSRTRTPLARRANASSRSCMRGCSGTAIAPARLVAKIDATSAALLGSMIPTPSPGATPVATSPRAMRRDHASRSA